MLQGAHHTVRRVPVLVTHRRYHMAVVLTVCTLLAVGPAVPVGVPSSVSYRGVAPCNMPGDPAPGRPVPAGVSHDWGTPEWTDMAQFYKSSRLYPEPERVHSSSTVEGDLLTLRVDWDPALNVTATEILVGDGPLLVRQKDIVISTPGYDPREGAINPEEFSWVSFKCDNRDGQVGVLDISVTVDFTVGDCDIWVWQGSDGERSSWRTDGSLSGDRLATSSRPEHTVVTGLDPSKEVWIGCLSRDHIKPGKWTLRVTPADGRRSGLVSGSSASVDVEGLNGRFCVGAFGVSPSGNVTCWLWDITLATDFAPLVTLVRPHGGEKWFAPTIISWRYSDRDLNDTTHTATVYVSTDGGETYMLYRVIDGATSCSWCPAEWAYGTQYRVRVVVSDGHMSGSDESGSDFTTGLMGLQDDSPPEVRGKPVHRAARGQSVSTTWEAADEHPATYESYLNGSLSGTGAWDNGITTVTAGPIPDGTYNWTVVFYDAAGNRNASTTWLFLGECRPVVLRPRGLLTVSEGDSIHIKWEAYAPYPEAYRLYLDGEAVTSGTWSGSPIATQLQVVGVGRHVVTLRVYDSILGAKSAWVVVVVRAAPVPTGSAPEQSPTTGGGQQDGVWTHILGMVTLAVTAGSCTVMVVGITLIARHRLHQSHGPCAATGYHMPKYRVMSK